MLVEFEIYSTRGSQRISIEAHEIAAILEGKSGMGTYEPVTITTKEGEKFQVSQGYLETLARVKEGRKNGNGHPPKDLSPNQDPSIGGCLRT